MKSRRNHRRRRREEPPGRRARIVSPHATGEPWASATFLRWAGAASGPGVARAGRRVGGIYSQEPVRTPRTTQRIGSVLRCGRAPWARGVLLVVNLLVVS